MKSTYAVAHHTLPGFVITLALCAFAVASQAQERRRIYDSLLVGDVITPAVSSVMMPASFTEVIWINSLLTSNSMFTGDRRELNAANRTTVALSTLQVTHGISRSGRFNAGLDLNYRIGRQDSDPNSSPLAVYGNESDGLIQYERGFTSVAVRARYVPIGRHRNFVVQQSFYLPFNPASSQSAFLGDNRYMLNTQLLYNHLLGKKFFLFGQFDFLIRFKDERNTADFINPINIFASYLLDKHVFPFVQIGMSNSFANDFAHYRQSFSYGFGVQVQFTTMFTLNAFYNDTFAGMNANHWKAINLGLRAVL